MQDQIGPGDIVQIEYVRRVVGYLYKDLEDRMVISPTTEIEDNTKFKVVLKKDIVEISGFSTVQRKVEQEKEPDQMGKIIQFPTNKNGEEEIQ